MEEQKRVRRTPEQVLADLDTQVEALTGSIQETETKKAASAAQFDAKIAKLKGKIAALQEKKKNVLQPAKRKVQKRKPRKTKAEQIKDLVKQAQKSGLKLDEIAEKLGVATEE